MSPAKLQLLQEYFKSVEHTFHETLKGQRRPNFVTPLVIGSFCLFVSSILSLLPSALAESIPGLVKSKVLIIRGFSVPLTSLWFWWPVCAAATLGLLIITIKWDDTRDKANKKKWLSEPQMRFACCYSIIDEISKYRTNGIQRHADEAFKNWTRLRTRLPQMPRPFSTMYPSPSETRRFGSRHDDAWTKEPKFIFYPEIELLRAQFPWFRLDPRTDAVIEAFYTIPAKIQDRLREKKDLDLLSACLTELSAYLYSRIPDVPSRHGNESLAEYGDQCLQSLVERIRDLPPYISETKPTTNHVQFWKNAVWTLSKMTAPFAHSNIFLCFLAWWALTLLLTLGALKTVLHFLPGLTIDSVIVSLIVGGPLACAVSAVAISRARRRDESASKEPG